MFPSRYKIRSADLPSWSSEHKKCQQRKWVTDGKQRTLGEIGDERYDDDESTKEKKRPLFLSDSHEIPAERLIENVQKSIQNHNEGYQSQVVQNYKIAVIDHGLHSVGGSNASANQ